MIRVEAPVIDVWPPEHHTRILPESSMRSADPDEYVQGVLKSFITRAYRRPASADELERFFKIYKMLTPGFARLEETMGETLSIAASSVTTVNTISQAAATSAGTYALAAPISAPRSMASDAWASYMDPTLYPMSTKRRAIFAPILPTPTKPIFSLFVNVDGWRNRYASGDSCCKE